MIRRMNYRRVWRPLMVAIACLVPLSIAAPAVDAYTGSADSANARYLIATYQQMLGRDPDDASLDRHLAEIAAGGDVSRKTVTETLLFGPEASGREVDRAYSAILQRPAEPTGKQFWSDHLQTHDVLDLRVLLFSSDEYFNRSGGTNQEWIRSLYVNVLERKPEAAGIQYWVNEANRGTERPLIVAGFYLGPESLGNRTDEYYQLVFGRTASTDERSAGVELIANEGERGLYAELWASDELFEQFFDTAWSPR